MTYVAHRQYAICGAFIAAIVVYNLKLTEINYYIALVIMLMTAKGGQAFPDMDHDLIKEKTAVSFIVNKLIRLTGGKHRSWQTHSIDIALYCMAASYYVPWLLYKRGIISNVNKEILLVILFGFMSGWLSHLFSDMLTPAGVRLCCLWNKRIRIIPKKGRFIAIEDSAAWENFNYKVMRVINTVLGIGSIVYPFVIN